MNTNMNPDKLMKYTTMAEPRMSAFVPLKHHYKAKRVQSIALISEDMNEFYNRLKMSPSMEGVYIPDNVVKFVHSPKMGSQKEFKLWDDIYFSTCLHLMNDDLSTIDGIDPKSHHRALERYNAIKNKENLVRVMRML
ncbi:MAG: hypothetical protein GYA35_01200 [Thermoanaerobaculaceae bacterium]|nr:hypothetical protein [Thermoanaerobaculaceae bacterium]